MAKLSKQDEQKLVRLLRSVSPGMLTPDVFFAIARLVVIPSFTVVPLYDDHGTLQVHLTKRDTSNPRWHGLLATPGKVILPTDRTIDSTYARLKLTEMKGMQLAWPPVFCGYVFHRIPRGKEIALVSVTLLKGKPRYGELHRVTCLPENIIPSERERIRMAVKTYKTMQRHKL